MRAHVPSPGRALLCSADADRLCTFRGDLPARLVLTHSERGRGALDRITQAFEDLIERIRGWAEAEGGIRLALVVGSRARTSHVADEWSDLDVVLVTEQPQRYLGSTSWLDRIGPYCLTFLEPTAVGVGAERRVLFEGWLDVDFAILDTSVFEALASGRLPDADAIDTLRRGVRVLVDRDQRMPTILGLIPEVAAHLPPSREEFAQVVSDFWYHVVWTAKHLRRGELWWAKGCCDGLLKERLRQVLEWHARLVLGPDRDTWMRGRFLEEWADPRTVKELRKAFGHYDEADVWRALGVTMYLFRRIATETAGRLCFPYPTEGDQRATDFVNSRGSILDTAVRDTLTKRPRGR